MAMLAALRLSLAQLADPPVVAILLRSLALTLLVFVAAGGLAGWGAWTLAQSWTQSGEGLAAAAAAAVAAIAAAAAAWLWFRIVAVAVVQLFADEVVEQVEKRHYPYAHSRRISLGLVAEMRLALAGAVRALLWNLAALPLALVLGFTVVGPAMVYFAVNALLLGREFSEMVARRHPPRADGQPLAPGTAERHGLGALVTLLLLVPLVALVAPILGAAMATHLAHRRAQAGDRE